jgi:hypothetical protein
MGPPMMEHKEASKANYKLLFSKGKNTFFLLGMVVVSGDQIIVLLFGYKMEVKHLNYGDFPPPHIIGTSSHYDFVN